MDKVHATDTRINPAYMNGQWKESLFGCCDNPRTCCAGVVCLPCLFGRNAEKIDGSSCAGWSILYYLASHFYLCWIPHMNKRKLLRRKYNLKEEPCNDCLTTAFCGPCAVCQEAREIKARTIIPRGPNAMPVRVQPRAAYRK